MAHAREGLPAGDVSRRLGQFFDLGGIGFARGALSFSPRPLNFGNRPVFGTSGPSPIETVTLGNPSGVPILVGNITTSSNFQIVNPYACTPMLSPGQNCALRIKFAPDAVGPYRGMLTITDNSTSSPQTIALVGVGVPGTLSFAPTPLGFGKIKVGAASAPKPLKNDQRHRRRRVGDERRGVLDGLRDQQRPPEPSQVAARSGRIAHLPRILMSL